MFSTFSVDEFVQSYWQKRALVLKQEFLEIASVVDGNDLAGLACEEAVESRIIRGSGLVGPWSCEHGPFIDYDYDSLGPVDWTLLVQGLDQWDESVRTLLNRFSFLPAWRLEDVMASFAPTGGGVGPHFDYYDVFLIQAAGKRRWQLGEACDDRTKLQENQSVKLLQEFEPGETFDLGVGDALYIPAGLSHWGTSLSDDCVTLSVGFRAPSDRELLEEAVELLLPEMGDAKRYTDTTNSPIGDRFAIDASAGRYAKSVLSRLKRDDIEGALEQAFGRLVTDTRYCSFSEQTTHWTAEAIRNELAGRLPLAIGLRPHCRMAYTSSHLFVNGAAYKTSVEFSKRLCHGELSDSCDEAQWEIVATLFNDDMIELA